MSRKSKVRLKPEVRLTRLKIATAYAVVTGAWIFFSDDLLRLCVVDAGAFSVLQNFKNVLFVLLTTWFFYSLVHRYTLEVRRSEEALRRSEARNQALINAIPDLMLRIGKDGTYLEFRGAKGSSQTLPAGGFLGKTVHEVLPPDVASETISHIQQVLENGRPQVFEYLLTVNDHPCYHEARVVVSWEDEVLVIVRDITERKQAEEERDQLIFKLQDLLAEVKTLSGLLPICASCKRIRDDKGYWNQIEAYISDHSEAEFSHGICPDCVKKLYPDYYKRKQESLKNSP